MYIKLTNGQPEKYTIGQLRRDNPNVSFPKRPSDELLADWGVFKVAPSMRPKHDSMAQTIREESIVEIDGVWTQQWLVEDKPQETVEAIIRDRRNKLLEECDWTQVIDAPVDQTAWGAYRQALRDISSQEGFPYSVEWPRSPDYVEPEEIEAEDI